MTMILGIESSCDETAAAVLRDGRELLSNVVASQIELHRKYGGVFPEMASRQHILAITPTIREAMEKAEVTWSDLDAVAVVYGPGLAGSLLVGLNAAKAIAMAHNLPLVGINHLEAHVYANWLVPPNTAIDDFVAPAFPAVCLVVSGGHTSLILVRDHHDYTLLGRTIDDAAGEAFDKVARLLGLEYPGGPSIQKAAQNGNPHAFELPRSLNVDEFDFSFSGLKTAVLRLVQQLQRERGIEVEASGQRLVDATPENVNEILPVADLAASFQDAVVDILTCKTRAAAERYGAAMVLLAGGVSANRVLRERMIETMPVPVRVPPIQYCTDNAAMVAMAGHYAYLDGTRSGLDLDVVPSLALVEG